MHHDRLAAQLTGKVNAALDRIYTFPAALFVGRGDQQILLLQRLRGNDRRAGFMDAGELATIQVYSGQHIRGDLVVQLDPGKTQPGAARRKSPNAENFFIPHMVEREASYNRPFEAGFFRFRRDGKISSNSFRLSMK